jgi:hypothetical protein
VGATNHTLTIFMTTADHVSVKPPVSATVKFFGR